jgi:uncharacterized membrane protein YraQ (UPF0718 family)
MKASGKNNQQPKGFKGITFLGLVIFLYLILYFVNSDKTLQSIEHFIKNTWTVVPIFLIVILISALINYYFPKERLSKILQEKSGFQTYLVSLLAGSISMGPLFSWFPLLKNLKEKGLKDGVLVTFIYAKSIKLTLIPIMIGFFGHVYTIIFMLFIAFAAIVQGLLYEFISKKN